MRIFNTIKAQELSSFPQAPGKTIIPYIENGKRMFIVCKIYFLDKNFLLVSYLFVSSFSSIFLEDLNKNKDLKFIQYKPFTKLALYR